VENGYPRHVRREHGVLYEALLLREERVPEAVAGRAGALRERAVELHVVVDVADGGYSISQFIFP
jgi:hypothetical protein